MNPNDPNAQEDRIRLMLFMLALFVLMLGYKHFVQEPRQQELAKTQELLKSSPGAASSATSPGATPGSAPAAAVAGGAPEAPVSRTEAMSRSARVSIDGKRVEGSLALKGGRFDDLRLKDYYADLTKTDYVALLSPVGGKNAFYVDSGWLSADSSLNLPDKDTDWTLAPSSAHTLKSGGDPLVLTWDNGHGLLFERRVALDDNYLFTITQHVTNNSPKPVTLNPHHTTSRDSLPPDFRGFYALHEGPVGYVGGKTIDPAYSSVAKGVDYDLKDRQGWMGITDRYWLVAMLPEPAQTFNLSIAGKNFQAPGQHYQTDLVDTALTVAAGASAEEKSYLFAGAKDLKAIQDYQDRYAFKNFELSFDFGIYYIITKPFYYLLHYLVAFTGNVGFAMLLMTVIVRGGMFPIASKSFRSMAKMRVLGPKMKELQEAYKDDKLKLQQEVAALYQKEDVNMFSGCLPMFIQIPVFFALYKVILISVELRQAPFWGWIHDLSQPDPTTIFNLFGLIPWDMRFGDFALPHIGAWPVIYCLTMLFQKHISPPLPDPAQEKMQTYFPYLFSFMMAQFPVGLVIYYSWSNLLGVFQQYYILTEHGGQETSLIRGHSARRRKKDDDLPLLQSGGPAGMDPAKTGEDGQSGSLP